jgi:hypothetical protein
MMDQNSGSNVPLPAVPCEIHRLLLRLIARPAIRVGLIAIGRAAVIFLAMTPLAEYKLGVC